LLARRNLASLAATKNKVLNEALTWELTMNRKPHSPARAVPTIAEMEDGASDVVDTFSADLMARSNAIPVSVEDMHVAAAAINRLPLEERDWEGRAQCLMPLFRGRRDKAFVVNARLEALGQLLRDGELPYWMLPASRQTRNNDPVYFAAAKVPLLFAQKEPYFEVFAFVACVLERARVYGHA
jgi:hypothetical protein